MTETPDEQTVSSFTVKLPANFKPERKPPRLTLSDEQLADATYTAAEVKVLTEAALRLGRKEAGEDIATAINVARIQHHWNVIALAAAGECARIAREVASSPPQGAPEPRTDPKVDTDLPPEPQAVREPQDDPNG